MLELESFSSVLPIFWQTIKNWGWIVLPFLLYKPFLLLWLFWKNEVWLKTVFRPVFLEIKMPKEVLKPIRAMESVMASLHASVYHPPDWWEKWIEGQLQTSLSFEVASIDGEPHFYIRIHKAYREAVESSIYSQYPEAEIEEVEDYTKNVPQNIPNKDWNLFGSDYMPLKPDSYPIKTYSKFETERETKEEKRIDPVASLLEAMAKIKKGEQLWIQITATPMAQPDLQPTLKKFLKQGEETRDKLARRENDKPKPIIQEAAELLITGKAAEVSKKEKDIIPPEMKLTPGEREVIAAVEEKISKPIFQTNIRFIYLGKRDVWFKPNFRLAFSFFNSYTTINLNAIFPFAKTLTKIHKSWFLPINIFYSRRSYLRCRKIFRNYKERLTAFFPKDGGTFFLNTEEMASLFHFPSRTVAPAPSVPRIEAKRGEAPSGLPTE
ncbi:hypothetical protein ACFL0A_00965 [Patescibacteria group bacterium]